MSIAPRPRIPEFLPETAPFTPEQRTWLNGFFAGFISLEGGAITPLSPAESAALMPGGAMVVQTHDDDDDDAPWHDQTLPLAERMKLSDGRPLRRRMMAAMAQQDCGQCGYNCEDYSNAIFRKQEERLTLCVPGGKETARMLKTLYAELGQPPQPARTEKAPSAPATAAPAAAPGRGRDNPTEAVFVSRTRLNKPGSEKETWHVEVDLAGSGLDYIVGDSFGLFPANDPYLAEAVIRAID